MKTAFSLLFSLFILTKFSFCQNFKPASITFLSGAKDSGFIDMKSWNFNPKKVKFKNKEGIENIFTISDLQSFEVGKSKYVKAFINIDQQSVDYVNPYSSADSSKNDTVFLKLIVEGNPVNLYQYIDFKSHYYIKTDSIEMVELSYGLNNNKYIEQLKSIKSITWTDKLLNLCDNLNYTETDLTEFIKTANVLNSFKDNSTLEKKNRITLFAGAGIYYQTFRFNSDNFKYSEFNFSNSTSPIISVGFDYFLDKSVARTAMRLEFSYHTFKTEGTFVVPTAIPGVNQNVFYNLKQSNASISGGMIYSFINAEKLHFYGGGLITLNISNYSENSYKIFNSRTGAQLPEQYPLEFEKTWPVFTTQFGMIYNNHLEIRGAFGLAGSMLNSAFATEKGLKTSLRILYRL